MPCGGRPITSIFKHFRVRPEEAYGRQLSGRLGIEERAELIKGMMKRAAAPGRKLVRENSVSGQATPKEVSPKTIL